jgi:hypothetical protein
MLRGDLFAEDLKLRRRDCIVKEGPLARRGEEGSYETMATLGPGNGIGNLSRSPIQPSVHSLDESRSSSSGAVENLVQK